MNNQPSIYPPKVARASRVNGPRMATAPHNQDAPPGLATERSLPTDCQQGAVLEHDTAGASRAATTVPATPLPAVQMPGCLPPGYDLDSLLTIPEFAVWRRIAESTARAALPTTRGVISRSREGQRIHPRTFLELTLKIKR